jgi:protein TonB
METLFISLIALAASGIAGAILLVIWLMKNAAEAKESSFVPQTKKFAFADLERYRFLNTNIGFVISLALVLTAFEWKTYEQIKLPSFGVEISGEEMINIPVTKQEMPPPVLQKVLLNPEIKVVDDLKKIEEHETMFEADNTEDLAERTPLKITAIDDTPREEVEDEFVLVPEVAAEPLGGMTAFLKYLEKTLKYPRQAQKLGVEGKVYVQFVVNKDGKLSEINVMKGIGAGCDEEALRVVENAPAWKPARQRGREVKQRVVVPIVFRLSK